MIRIVMKKNQFFHTRLKREGHGIIHAAVAPTFVPIVFRTVVLRIQNQHVGTANKIKHLTVITPFAGLGVRKENNNAIRRKQAITHRHAGMIRPLGADEKTTDGKIKIG